MESTWESRDLPVLDAIVRIYDEEGVVTVGEIEQVTQFEPDAVQRALRALRHEEPKLFDTGATSMSGHISIVASVTGHARRAVGAWPTPESLADRIVEALDQAAQEATSDGERTRLRQASEALGGVGRGVVTGVLTHVLTGGM